MGLVGINGDVMGPDGWLARERERERLRWGRMRGAAEVHPWSSWHRLGLRSGVVAAVGDETTNGERRRCFRALFPPLAFVT